MKYGLIDKAIVEFEARRITGVTPLRIAEAAKHLVIRVKWGGNKRSHIAIPRVLLKVELLCSSSVGVVYVVRLPEGLCMLNLPTVKARR